MHTYTQILYQIIFHTLNNEKTLIKEHREELFFYIAKVIYNKKSNAYRIGGIEDHIHIITRIHPSIALSNLVKDIKLSSSYMIRKNMLFPNFRGWQHGFAAFTYSEKALPNLIEYVDNQEQHHLSINARDEIIGLLHENNVNFEERFLF